MKDVSMISLVVPAVGDTIAISLWPVTERGLYTFKILTNKIEKPILA